MAWLSFIISFANYLLRMRNYACGKINSVEGRTVFGDGFSPSPVFSVCVY